MGADDAVARQCAAAVDKYGEYVAAAADAPMTRQANMALLSYCCKPSSMLNHFARVVRPELTRPLAEAADGHMARAIAIATRTDPASLAPGLPSRTVEQLQLA